MTPRVSVVMTVYNDSRFLPEAVDSLLAQTLEDFELILIDDGSTDDTPRIVADYAARDSRVRVITNEHNLHQAAALNRGLEAARGEYIARHDADDRSFPTRLEKQANFLDRHPEFALAGAGGYVIDEEGAPAAPKRLETDPEALAAELLKKRNWIVHGAMMFRTALGLRYRDKFPPCEDIEFLLRLLSAGLKFTNVPEYLYQYRLSRGQLTMQHKLAQDLYSECAMRFYRQRLERGADDYETWDHQAELEAYRQRVGEWPVLTDAEFNYRRGLLYQYFTNGVYGEALRHAAYLLAHYPPWRLGLRWSALLPGVALKSLLMLALGRSRPRGFDWPE